MSLPVCCRQHCCYCSYIIIANRIISPFVTRSSVNGLRSFDFRACSVRGAVNPQSSFHDTDLLGFSIQIMQNTLILVVVVVFVVVVVIVLRWGNKSIHINNSNQFNNLFWYLKVLFVVVLIFNIWCLDLLICINLWWWRWMEWDGMRPHQLTTSLTFPMGKKQHWIGNRWPKNIYVTSTCKHFHSD